MAVYAVGDIQGCAIALEELLDEVNFDPARDRLWLTGDLVNRGPHSLETLRLVKSFGESAIVVLGNHDLHLLAVAEGFKRLRRGNTMKKILKAPDRDELLHWLRHRPLVHMDHEMKVLMVHAGVYPGWGPAKLQRRANEVERRLRGDDYRSFLHRMYGRRPGRWDGQLKGMARIRFITNTLTRMRYINEKGRLDYNQKGPPGSQPKKLYPWYQHPDMKCRKWRIVFGHWSAHGFIRKGRIIGLDSGCVWGGALTTVRLDGGSRKKYWQVNCP